MTTLAAYLRLLCVLLLWERAIGAPSGKELDRIESSAMGKVGLIGGVHVGRTSGWLIFWCCRPTSLKTSMIGFTTYFVTE